MTWRIDFLPAFFAFLYLLLAPFSKVRPRRGRNAMSRLSRSFFTMYVRFLLGHLHVACCELAAVEGQRT